MGKFVINLLLWVLALALSIFTASRTLDLMSQWLPAGQDIYQWLALAAFEGGFYFWAGYFALAAEGAQQRGVAFLMVVIDFIGIAIATVADLTLAGAKSGKLPPIGPDQQQAIVVAVGVVIVLNVAAFLACKLISPTRLRQWAVQEAEDQISHEELQSIKRAAPRLAQQVAPHRAQQWVDQTWDKLLPGTVGPDRLALPAPQTEPLQLPAPEQVSVQQTGELAEAPDEQPKKRGLLSRLLDPGRELRESQRRLNEAQAITAQSYREEREEREARARLDLIDKTFGGAPSREEHDDAWHLANMARIDQEFKRDFEVYQMLERAGHEARQAGDEHAFRACAGAEGMWYLLDRDGRAQARHRFSEGIRGLLEAKHYDELKSFTDAEVQRELARQQEAARPTPRPFLAANTPAAAAERRHLRRSRRAGRKQRSTVEQQQG